MTAARWRVTALLGIALTAAGCARQNQQPDAGPTTRLLLLTSLPLLFSEGFSLEGGGSPALAALEKHYVVVPISVASPEDLSKARMLLMDQPRAQTAENLVALDAWVRRGGRLLLFADPLLVWPSKRPRGDPLRPPTMFADTGLLAHWGLRLDAPETRGPVLLGEGANAVGYIAPGRLVAANSDCQISRADIVATCRIGKGRVLVVADADFFSPTIAELRNPRIDNTHELLALLDELRADPPSRRVTDLSTGSKRQNRTRTKPVTAR